MKKLSKHTLVGENDSHFVLHDGDGHFPIAKKGLDASTIDKIRKFKKFAEGGDVSTKEEKVTEESASKALGEPKSAAPMKQGAVQMFADGGGAQPLPDASQDASGTISVAPSFDSLPAALPPVPLAMQDPNAIGQPSPASTMQDLTMLGKSASDLGLPGMLSAPGNAQPTDAPTPAGTDGSAPTSDSGGPANTLPQGPANPMLTPQGMMSPVSPNMVSAITDQQNAIRMGANAKAQGEDDKADATSDLMDTLQDAQDAHATEMTRLNQRGEQLFQQAQEGKIDPDHYWNSKNTGQKIGAAIAIMIGGIAQGYGKTNNNVALDIINKSIDQDIQAQRDNMTQKNNLFNLNLEKTRNVQSAYAQTKSDAISLTQAQIANAVANAGSTEAKANGNLMIAQLQEQKAQLNNQIAVRSTLMSGAAGQNPASLVPYLVPKEDQKGVYAEIKRAQDTHDSANDILKSFDESVNALKSYKGLGRAAALFHEPREMAGFEAQIGTTVGDLEGSVRQAAMDNVKHSFKPKLDDTDNDFGKRRQELVKYLQTKASAPMAFAHGIDLNRFRSTAPVAASSGNGSQAINFTPIRSSGN